ncbi:hypothetical protein BOX37_31380 [Nocardia mangyaensis]|uniref:Uncharacterized protein n=1 Tax=Nocardia mangyaensis TaxID=2213200 RepID=A0A1J0W0F9_9NOCA|nr:hypothetical protein [Nocardia mangyaensis]APE37697.1 hypothetical protein BOX37_31380 [Nocardia mangyaensis]
MIRLVVATAAVAGIATATASPAMATPAAPAVIAESGSAGTGSAVLDFPIGFLKLILCGTWASPEPHYIPLCR